MSGAQLPTSRGHQSRDTCANFQMHRFLAMFSSLAAPPMCRHRSSAARAEGIRSSAPCAGGGIWGSSVRLTKQAVLQPTQRRCAGSVTDGTPLCSSSPYRRLERGQAPEEEDALPTTGYAHVHRRLELFSDKFSTTGGGKG